MTLHCDICDIPFTRVSSLNGHMRVFHASREPGLATQSSSGVSDLVCIVNGVRVRSVDMQRLAPGGWLNDVIVDAYASLFPFDLRKCFVHSCFFYSMLQTHSLERLARVYTRKRAPDFLALERVFLPINVG